MRSTVGSFPGGGVEKLRPVRAGAITHFVYTFVTEFDRLVKWKDGQAQGNYIESGQGLVRLPESGRGAPSGRPFQAIPVSEFRWVHPAAKPGKPATPPTAVEQRTCVKIGPCRRRSWSLAISHIQILFHERLLARPTQSAAQLAPEQPGRPLALGIAAAISPSTE